MYSKQNIDDDTIKLVSLILSEHLIAKYSEDICKHMIMSMVYLFWDLECCFSIAEAWIHI